jgi:pantoate--beta-alanine ligase
MNVTCACVATPMNKNISGLKHRRPRIARTLPVLKRVIDQWRRRGDVMALVPTMGALHAGHHALVQLARRRAERVIVSIFINPTQFAPNEDLATYPRTFAADVAALGDGRADLVWAPSTARMYPDGFATLIVPQGPALAGLEDAYRPHFFGGVATVVAKLLIQCEPDIAVFGEKDYQQLVVVRRLTRDLGLNTHVIGAPTVREPDGLALSSRNRYLSAKERAAAPTLYRVLRQSAAEIAAGKPAARVLARGRAAIKAAGFALDYLEARDSDTLAPHGETDSRLIRLLVAARLGKTRLIDNLGLKLPR